MLVVRAARSQGRDELVLQVDDFLLGLADGAKRDCLVCQNGHTIDLTQALTFIRKTLANT